MLQNCGDVLTFARTHFARAERVVALNCLVRPDCVGMRTQCASDTLADSRVQKPKNFLAFSSRLLPPPLHREAEKEMERKFLVLLRRYQYSHLL
jgi:hypothetical protein